ncbi:MAG: hypothetical protein GX308_09865 [Epulopiscium sp.]|nr:hypothetical protein [Candidatus Epulonipiscium sp.]
MNFQEIENLKSILTRFIMNGCNIQCDSRGGINGRVVAVGFKPLWPSPIDSRIDKIEFNYMDQQGGLNLYSLSNVIGYEILSYDGDSIEDSNKLSLDMHIYSPAKSSSKEPFDKVHIDIRK